MEKKLYKSENKKICGVCAGFAEYIDCDPVLIRVIYILIAFFTGLIPGLILYFILAAIIPDRTTI